MIVSYGIYDLIIKMDLNSGKTICIPRQSCFHVMQYLNQMMTEIYILVKSRKDYVRSLILYGRLTTEH